MRSIAVPLLKLAVAGAAFALLFRYARFDQVTDALRLANPLLVAAGVLVFLAGQVVAAARWRRILQSDAVELPLGRVLRLNLLGTFAGNFLPGMATGDLVKSAMLCRDFPEQRAFLVASVVYDRIAGLAAILILMLIASLAPALGSGQWGFAGYALAVGAPFAVAVWLAASGFNPGRLLDVLPRALAARLASFGGALQGLLRRRGLALRTLAAALLFQLLWVAAQWLMLSALSAHAPLAALLLASTFSLVVAMLPISLNGLGLREGTFSVLLEAFGVEPHTAVAAALLSLLPILVSSAIGGALFAWGGGRAETRVAALAEPGRPA